MCGLSHAAAGALTFEFMECVLEEYMGSHFITTGAVDL